MNRSIDEAEEFPGVTRGLSSGQVLKLGWTPGRLRYMIATGVIRPRRRGTRWEFRFDDLVLLRTLRRLEAEGVPRRRLYRAFRNLHRQVGPGVSVASVQLSCEEGRLLARRGRQVWHPETGQICLPGWLPA